VINAGAIEGTVDLGYTPYFGRSYASGLYVAAGGTLTGDLLFGSGNDVIVETGSGLGVSGKIDAGSGALYLGHERSHTASITLQAAPPAGFQREFVSARGQDTVLTITAASTVPGDIMLAGDGQIVNEASTHGSIIGPDSTLLSFSYFSSYLASFTNKAQVDGQIRLGFPRCTTAERSDRRRGLITRCTRAPVARFRSTMRARSLRLAGAMRLPPSGWMDPDWHRQRLRTVARLPAAGCWPRCPLMALRAPGPRQRAALSTAARSAAPMALRLPVR
jgi:hypothetical protein